MHPIDTARKATLETEVVDVLETYGNRLLVIERTLDDTAETTMADQLECIRIENDNARDRLESLLSEAARCHDQTSDLLSSVWNTTRMKILYHGVLKDAVSASQVCATWKSQRGILEILEYHNRDVFGPNPNDAKNYVNVFTYPNIVKDHLFNIQHILEKYGEIVSCRAYKRFVDLIRWLDHEHPQLTSIKGLDASTIYAEIERSDEVILEQSRMRMPSWDSADANLAELYMSESLVVVRTIPRWMFARGKTEFKQTALVDLEEGDDERTLHVLGIGFRKVLIADNREKRDEWLRTFREIKLSNVVA
ncbi:uncharacterized protein LOC100902842 [Galendromus occidentalis]|uniref:Uncharacterized protein LOC100902842 n=1 Tax=Galendromus occidentalis TaxID=34638 RepID=A0AAJ6QTS1_9ACAR|nr:uncharacterized protein LOC100902842 [Galendromus occidentalis]